MSYLPAAPSITSEGLVHLVAGTRQDPLALALAVLRRARFLLRREIGAKDDSFHVWGAGALALAALRMPTDPLAALSPIPVALVDSLLHRVAGLSGPEPQDHPENSDGQVSDEFRTTTLLSLVRTLAQSSLQGDELAQLFRTLYLLELADADGSLREESRYDSLFMNALGGRALDYLSLMCAFYAASVDLNLADLRQFFSGSSRRAELEAMAVRIFERQGCRKHEVESLCVGTYEKYVAEGLAQAFFTQRPFIRIDRKRWLLPLPAFARFLALSGAFFTTLELAREDAARREQPNPWTNAHSRGMGDRFESLVGETLRGIGGVVVETEYEYLQGKTDLSPDFLLFEKGSSAVLVQAKLKRLSPGAFFGFDIDDVEKDSEGPLSEMIWRSIRYLYRLATPRASGRLNSGGEAVSRRVLGTERILLLGVVPAMPAIFRVPEFRELVERGVLANLSDEEGSWYGEQVATGRIAGWHVIDWTELDSFARVGHPGHCLQRELSSYLDLIKGGLFGGTEMLPSFRDWHIQLHESFKPEAVDSHRRAFEQFWMRVLSILSLPALEADGNG